MKRLILSALFAIFISLAAQASASAVTSSVQAAINSNNFAQIEAIAAGNPGAQGEIAMYLLQQAQSKMASNPSLAAKIFEAAGPYVSQIPAAQSASAAGMIGSIVDTANGAGFQSGNPGAASAIFGAAIGMANQPNILAANPKLYETSLANANAFLEKNPQGAEKKLKDIVSLAQAPGAPRGNAIGAHIPTEPEAGKKLASPPEEPAPPAPPEPPVDPKPPVDPEPPTDPKPHKKKDHDRHHRHHRHHHHHSSDS